MLLIDEFHRGGVELIFINHPHGQSPEDELLLQMQGMIAEYERAQILERSRRGKRHKAQQDSVNVLGGAPYGYRYVTIAEGGGQARYEIIDEQAQVVRQVFDWIGRERLSIGEVERRLTGSETLTATGKTWWDRSVIWAMAVFVKIDVTSSYSVCNSSSGWSMTSAAGLRQTSVTGSQFRVSPLQRWGWRALACS